jgi:hypothetical protein
MKYIFKQLKITTSIISELKLFKEKLNITKARFAYYIIYDLISAVKIPKQIKGNLIYIKYMLHKSNIDIKAIEI